MATQCTYPIYKFNSLIFTCNELEKFDGQPVLIDQSISFNNKTLQNEAGQKFLRLKVETFKPGQTDEPVQHCSFNAPELRNEACNKELEKYFKSNKKTERIIKKSECIHLKRKEEQTLDRVEDKKIKINLRPVCAPSHHKESFFYCLAEILDEKDKVRFRGAFVLFLKHVSGTAGTDGCEIPLVAVK